MDAITDLEYLLRVGFKQEYVNDPTYPHLSWRLDIAYDHNLLKGIHLVIGRWYEDRPDWVIEVWCLDYDESPVILQQYDYTKEALDNLLRQFNLL